MDGYEKHLIEVKMAKRHLTKYLNYCMYILTSVAVQLLILTSADEVMD